MPCEVGLHVLFPVRSRILSEEHDADCQQVVSVILSSLNGVLMLDEVGFKKIRFCFVWSARVSEVQVENFQHVISIIRHSCLSKYFNLIINNMI